MESFIRRVERLGKKYGAIKVVRPSSVLNPWNEDTMKPSDVKMDLWLERMVRRKGEYFEIQSDIDHGSAGPKKPTDMNVDDRFPSNAGSSNDFENNVAKAIAYYWRSLTHDSLWYGYTNRPSIPFYFIPSISAAQKDRVHLRSNTLINTWPNVGHLFAGKWKTTLPWRVESPELHAVQVHLGGSSLQWYVIPSAHSESFKKLAGKLAQDEHWRCSDFLLHQNILFPPSTLVQNGIVTYSTVLKQDELLITFPGTHHSAFCLGDAVLRRFVFRSPRSASNYEFSNLRRLMVSESLYSSKSLWPHSHKPQRACSQKFLDEFYLHDLPESNIHDSGNFHPIHSSVDNNSFSQRDFDSPNSINPPSPLMSNHESASTEHFNSTTTTEKELSSLHVGEERKNRSLPLSLIWNSKAREEYIKKQKEENGDNIEFSHFDPLYTRPSSHPLHPPPILGLPVPAQFARGELFLGRILEDRVSEHMLLLECEKSDVVEVPYECILTSSSAAGRRESSYYNPALKAPNIVYDDGVPINWNEYSELPSLDRFVLPKLLPGKPIEFTPPISVEPTSIKTIAAEESSEPTSSVDVAPTPVEDVNVNLESISNTNESVVDLSDPLVSKNGFEDVERSSVADLEEDVLETRSSIFETSDIDDRLTVIDRSQSVVPSESEFSIAGANLTRRNAVDFSVSLDTYELYVSDEVENVDDFSLFPSLE